MSKIKVLAVDATQAGRNQKRGKLFEAVMADTLRGFGYRIDRIANVNYSGMEIDIEGTHIVSGLPLYAECKCYESEVDSPKFQAFFGKYIARWWKDKRGHGLFIAIPGINSHAKGFYNDNCASNSEFTLRVCHEDDVIKALIESGKLKDPALFGNSIPAAVGTAGEAVVLVTEHGTSVVQWVIPTGSVIPSKIVIFDGTGSPISDRTSVERFLELDPELRSFEYLNLATSTTVTTSIDHLDETIVEVKSGTECFEFQFPASPEHFVGRGDILREVKSFSELVSSDGTSLRGVLFEANSGWGKSSCVLACADALQRAGHHAVVIDSRSAISAQFILRAIEYTLGCLDAAGVPEARGASDQQITGFEGAASQLIDLGNRARASGKLVFVFFDQFENVFFLPDAFRRIRDVFLKLSAAATHVLFGFCWKTDLVGLTNDFPYQLRDSIRSACRVIPVTKFSEAETNALLDKLSGEIHARLRKDLRFFLSEFSQGYPWLLKKLCAHVKAQRESGVSQADIANGLLNVEQLFEEDMNGLSPEEEDALRRVAKLSPVAVLDLGEELKPAVIQSLIDRRLIVRIGVKLDIYWDIFRDYLNTGKVPAQEQYLPRLGPRSIYRTCRLIAEAAKPISVTELSSRLKLSKHSTYNVVHEMRMLGLARVADDAVVLRLTPVLEKEFLKLFTQHVGDKLRRNRLVQSLLEVLETAEQMTISEVASLLRDRCPYISASEGTWEGYAETFCDWLDAGDAVLFDKRRKCLNRFAPGREVRERQFTIARKRGGLQTLPVQYSPVETLLAAYLKFLRERVWDAPIMKPSTRRKAISILEDFGLVLRTSGSVRLLPPMTAHLHPQADLSRVLGEAASATPSFRHFLEILETHREEKCSVLQLGRELKRRLDADWTDGTASTVAKILLDWARHTNKAPGVFADARLRSAAQNTLNVHIDLSSVRTS